MLWWYVPYNFCNRLDFLTILFFSNGLWCGRRKLQLYLAVECGKLGLQLFQFVLLFPFLARYRLELRNFLF